jgi:hypothetical protein
MRKLLLPIILLGVAIALGSFSLKFYKDQTQSSEARNLERVIKLIERKKPFEAIDQKPCKSEQSITEQIPNPTTGYCVEKNLRSTQFFELLAKRDSEYAKLQASLLSPEVERILVKFKPDGTIEFAEFEISQDDTRSVQSLCFCDRRTYIYHPNYTQFPAIRPSLGNPPKYEKIDTNWYLQTISSD